MSDKKKSAFGGMGKGLYIALVLCAAAIGITSYVFNREPAEAGNQPSLEAQLPVESLPENVEAIATGPVPETVISQVPETAPKPLKTTSPLAGKEVFGYSMETLSYNQTTRDWRTHDGVDIAAEAGAEVVAAADGEVYTTYEDESLGYTVVIRHEDGYTTRYSSLSEDLQVKPGDRVSMGQVIGTVDSTALVETALGPHLHFSVSHRDIPMDPAEFLALGE